MSYLNQVKKKGNFAFIAEYDEKLYKEFLNAEKMIRTNRDSAAENLRKALESFYKNVTKKGNDAYMLNLYTKIHKNKSYYSKVMDAIKQSKLYGLQNLYHGAKQDVFCADLNKVRNMTNTKSHSEDEEWEKDKPKCFEDYIWMFKRTFYMLRAHYISDMKRRNDYLFYVDYIPINDYFIHDVKKDNNSDCILSCYGLKRDSRDESETQFAVFKIYIENDQSTSYLKEYEGLKHVDRYTSDHRYFARRFCEESIYEDEATDDKTYIIRYELDQTPEELSKEFLSKIDFKDKKHIARQVVEALTILHNLHDPIWHRNINHENVLICKYDDGYRPYLVNFEYTKFMGGIAETNHEKVLSKTDMYKPSWLNSLYPEYLNNGEIGKFWEKLDVYSLAVLLIFILTSHEFTANVSSKPLKEAGYNQELISIIDKMIGFHRTIPSLADIKDSLTTSLNGE